MDPLTHALVGLNIKNLGFKQKKALMVLVLSAILPDVDYISLFWGMDSLLRWHRGITHGLIALAVVPAAIAFAAGGKKQFLRYYGISLLGFGSHIALDLINPAGIRLFLPLDSAPLSAGWMFSIEPWFTVILVFGAVMAYKSKKAVRMSAAVALCMAIGLIAVRAHLHDRADEFMRSNLDRMRLESVYPLPNDFLRWWFVAASDDQVKVGYADLFTNNIFIQSAYKANTSSLAAERSKQFESVREFLSTSRHPYAVVTKGSDGTKVSWHEISYIFAPGERLALEVEMDEDGRMTREKVYKR